MARKEEEFYRPDENPASTRRSAVVSSPTGHEDDELDERAVDLEMEEEESPFLRAQRRVPVRRAVTRRTANRLKITLVSLTVLALAGGLAGLLYAYGTGSWRFRIDSSDNLEIAGLQNVGRRQVLDVFGADIGRNIFFVPLEQRRAELEQIPWVESAAVMRLLPNRIRVQITERTPAAFIQAGSKVSLIDANGVVMEMPPRAAHNYSFPVIMGTSPDEPTTTLAARMKTYMRLVNDLDSGGAHYSQALSEVNLNDPDDVKATFTDASGAVLVHLGDDQFLQRYKIYLAHVNEWRQQFPHLDSVDLRYDRQVIVNPDARATGTARPAATGPASAPARAKPH